jgi:nicotinamide-nucleotide amidase
MRAAPAEKLVSLCRARALKLTTAESCTGGLVAGAITAIPGASEILDYGFITYSNAAKTKLLGVPAGLITAAGAVSEAVARRMASRWARSGLASRCAARRAATGQSRAIAVLPAAATPFEPPA